MQTLFVYLNTGQTFDPEKVKQDLETIEGTYDINGETLSDSPVACHYKFSQDRTTVRLADNLQAITMNGLGDASLQMALELQRREKRPLKVFNDGFDFHFTLDNVKTLAEMKRLVKDQYHDAEIAVA